MKHVRIYFILLLILTIFHSETMAANKSIIIIGAGASGYAAACKLLEHGFNNINILEAESRIGGRVHSVPFGDGIVDLGGQWVHGEKNNIVYNMVKDMDLIQHSLVNYTRFTFVDSNGHLINSNVSDPLMELLFSLTGDTEQLKAYNGSLGEFVTNKYYEKLNSDYPDVDRKVAKQILDWFHKFENNLNASPNWFDISAKGYASYEDCEGDLTLNWKGKGYHTIFKVLNKELPDPSKNLPIDDKILLNKEVTKIIWGNVNDSKNIVTVECSDGSSYEADHVITTVSLAVLKDVHSSMFVPELPTFKKTAVEGLAMGTVDKIWLKFPKRWWPENCTGFDLVWGEEASKKLILDYPEGPNKNGKSWLECILGFHPVDNNPTVLLGWINGELVEESESLGDEAVVRGSMYLLQRFLGKHYEIPQPESVLRSGWRTNKHFRGSYSYRSLKTEALNTGAANLAQPLANNSLLFAGEATHSTFYSTVHGAIETGFREALRIINHYNNPPPNQICKVAIVGAGMAGLAAALTLTQAGYKDILLLEAQKQPGGRIQTLEINNGYIDLGAQWLHGDKNLLWKISHSNDLISSKTIYEGRGVFLREDGFKFDKFLVEKVDFVIGQILEQCEEFVDSLDTPDSVGTFLEEKFGEFLKTQVPSEEMRLYLELYDWNVRFQVIDNCCDNLYNVSAKFWGRYFCPTSGGQAHINYTKGHGSVVDILLNKLPIDILKTNCPVTNINWKNNVKITCQDSNIIEAEAVIVTSSLGVLKTHSSKLFSPNLPNEMTEIIDAMGFHSICKIFLLFEDQWWGSEEGIQLIWNYDHKYGDDWIRYLSGFDPVLDQPCMLLGWIGGRGAELVERIPEEEIGEKCAELLRKFTGNMKISKPIQVVRTTWSSNPWILGGYSHTTPRCDSRVLLPETLLKPLRDENGTTRILLAGEHTHPEHFSTTHGAYESGVRQANHLLNESIFSEAKQSAILSVHCDK